MASAREPVLQILQLAGLDQVILSHPTVEQGHDGLIHFIPSCQLS